MYAACEPTCSNALSSFAANGDGRSAGPASDGDASKLTVIHELCMAFIGIGLMTAAPDDEIAVLKA